MNDFAIHQGNSAEAKNEPRRDSEGRLPGEPGHNPFATRSAGASKTWVVPATVVSGHYAAKELCSGRYPLLEKLTTVRVDDLIALRIVDRQSRPTDEDVTAWHQDRGRIWNPPPVKDAATRSDVRAAVSGIDPSIPLTLADIVAEADNGQQWAVAVVERARADNKYVRMFGKQRGTRPVSFTPGQLFERKVPQEAIAALPKETPHSRGASADIINTWDAEDRLQANTNAKRAEAAKAAAGIEIPDVIDLSTHAPADEPFVVDGLLPVAKSMGLFAERKAGKTTAVVDLVRALLSGAKFLNRFPARLPDGARVVLLDTEMGADMMQFEFDQAAVDRELLTRLDYHDLMGLSRLLDVRDEAARSRWCTTITPGSFLIVDCLYTVISALGVDENSSQVAEIIEGLKALAVGCDAAGLVIVHHLGKDPSSGARGHSSIEGAVDTIATIRLDGPLAGDTPRLFSAVGRRGVDVPLSRLTRGDDRRLTLSQTAVQDDRRQARQQIDDDATWDLIDAHPGLSVRALGQLPEEVRGKLSRDRIRDAVARLELVNRVINKGTEKNPKWHALSGVDPFRNVPAEDH